jgi:hypothetical protein
MTHEERATWIRRGIILFLAILIGGGVWLFPGKKPAAVIAPAEESVDINAVDPAYYLNIFHYHLPEDPASEQIAESLDRVGELHEKYVKVTRVDITEHPEIAKAEIVTKPPKVVMIAGGERVCKFQGVWTYEQIELRVSEILRGLKRMDKDWRPEVQGMQRASNVAPVSPLAHGQP